MMRKPASVASCLAMAQYTGLRDARVHQIVEGTNEIMRVIVSRRMLETDPTEDLR